MKFSLCIFSILWFTLGIVTPASAQQPELTVDTSETVLARVMQVLSQEERRVVGTDASTTYQTLRVEILEGKEKGKVVEVNNDYLALKEGQSFYLVHIVSSFDGKDMYSVSEPYRLHVIIFFVILFVVLVCLFGGFQGIRGLLSLIGSMILIVYVLVPSILGGYSPIAVSLCVASLIIILGSYVTHGFNKTTTAAVMGMIITILFTGALAYIAVDWAGLSGFSDEAAVYLNFNTRGAIDFVGLLLSGILIGLLGVLYDVSIGQAIAVEELHTLAPHVGRRAVYKRAIRIGREHIGALVNTLAIAYVGVSLPILLLYSQPGSESVGVTLNRELFAAEILRTMIGSIGLIIAVPITTLITVTYLIRPQKGAISQEKLAEETQNIEHFEHRH